MTRLLRNAGFTLLEVMVAVTVLGSAMVVIVQAQTRSVAASQHAQQMTTAVFLARAALTRLEEDLEQNGFPQLDDVREGTFEEDGQPQFRYVLRIEKMELPSNMGEMAQQTASAKQAEVLQGVGAKTGSGTGTTTSSASGTAQMVFSQFEIIRGALEQSVRRAVLQVFWLESGREQSMEIDTFFTDPSKVDASLPGLAGLAGSLGQPQGGQGTQGTQSTPGTPQGTGTTPSTGTSTGGVTP